MLTLPECITWLAVGLTECAAIVLLNIITIAVFIKNRNLRKRSMYLVINLAVVDMLTGAFAINDLFYDVGARCNLWKDLSPENLPVIYSLTLLVRFFPVASIINIAAISFERLHATLHPIKHRFLNKKTYGLLIAVVWVTAGIVTTALYYHFYGAYFFVSFCSVCLSIICVSSACIVCKVRFGAQPQHHGAASRERKLTITLLIVTVVSLLLYLPYMIVNYLYCIKTSGLNPGLVPFHLNNAIVVLVFGNSLVNPILYAIRIPEYRSAVIALFRRRPQKQVMVLPFHIM